MHGKIQYVFRSFEKEVWREGLQDPDLAACHLSEQGRHSQSVLLKRISNKFNFCCLPITRQLDRSIAHVGPKYKAKKFIAYFLNYTNTYAPPEDFRSWVEEAMAHPDVVGVDVSTRPDCVNERYLEILKESSEKYGKDVTVELGLQSSNAHTLLKLGRCHTAAEYVDAALRIGRYGFDQCTHVIADLPWDDRVDVIAWKLWDYRIAYSSMWLKKPIQ